MKRGGRVRTPRRALKRHDAGIDNFSEQDSYSRGVTRRRRTTGGGGESPQTEQHNDKENKEKGKRSSFRTSTNSASKFPNQGGKFAALENFDEESRSYQRGGRLPSPMDVASGFTSGKKAKSCTSASVQGASFGGKKFFGDSESSLMWVGGTMNSNNNNNKRASVPASAKKVFETDDSSNSRVYSNPKRDSEDNKPLFGRLNSTNFFSGTNRMPNFLQFHASNIFDTK